MRFIFKVLAQWAKFDLLPSQIVNCLIVLAAKFSVAKGTKNIASRQELTVMAGRIVKQQAVTTV